MANDIYNNVQTCLFTRILEWVKTTVIKQTLGNDLAAYTDNQDSRLHYKLMVVWAYGGFQHLHEVNLARTLIKPQCTSFKGSVQFVALGPAGRVDLQRC